MMNAEISGNACRETYIILNKLGLYERISEELKIYIEENQNLSHEFDFNEKMPLFYQIENDETKNFLTFLFIKYINTSETDAKMLKNTVVDIMKKNNAR